jgi:hypothetical protein
VPLIVKVGAVKLALTPAGSAPPETDPPVAPVTEYVISVIDVLIQTV